MENGPLGSSSPHGAGKVAVGHPVDVASGILFHLFDDYTMPGRFPISFKRRYSTGLLDRETAGMFGRGWSSPFDVKLYRDEAGFVYLEESGESEYAFVLPESGEINEQPVLNAGSFAELTATDSEYCVTRWNPDNNQITRDYFNKRYQAGVLPVTRREDGESNVLDFVYSQTSGLLKYVVQRREQRGLHLVYDESGRLLQVRRKSSRFDKQGGMEQKKCWLQYNYDSAGLLETFTDPLGNQSHYKYDASGRMISEVTLAGKEWRFVFDEQGHCLVTTSKNRFDYHRLDYGNEKSRVTKVEDSYGNVTQYHYNDNGQVVRQVSPMGHISSTIFDTLGRIIQLVSPEGRTESYEYDEAGNRSAIITANGARVDYRFNQRHQAISMVDPAGQKWLRTYDENGRMVSQSNPSKAQEHFSYDSSGDLTNHEDAEENIRSFSWDTHGNITGVTDWEGNTSRYQWDPFGSLVKYTDPSSQTTIFNREETGFLREIVFPDGGRRHYQWDSFGNLSLYTNEQGQTTRWKYCDCGNIESETRPDGSMITYGWNAIPGQLATLTNQKNEVYHFSYDADGRLIEEQNFSGSIYQYEYDSDNYVIRTRKPSGRETCSEYSSAGLVSRVIYSDGEETNFSYDLRGLMVSADNGQCPVSFAYDVVGRLIYEQQGDYELHHQYDALNQRIYRCNGHDDSTRFNWNKNGRISLVQAGSHPAVRFEYDACGQETQRYFEELKLDSRHDSRGRLTGQKLVSANNDTTIERGYAYDIAGNLIESQDNKWGTTQYVYDQLQRITRTLHPDGVFESFQYDDADNISSYARRKIGEVQRSEDAGWLYLKGNRPLENALITYDHDDDGRLVSRNSPEGKSQYIWNDAGQLISFINEAGRTWRYGYDALGRRVLKECAEFRTEYHWDGDVVLYEYTNHEEKRKTDIRWEFDPSHFSPMFRILKDEVYICINDQIGTTVDLVDRSGTRVWSKQAWTFGETKHSTGGTVDCPTGFQGQWIDEESGLCYNRFRYYFPEIAAFISEDPIGLSAGIHTRQYATNTTAWIDPFGLAKKCTEEITRRMSAEEAQATLAANGGKGGLVPRPGHERNPKWVTTGGADSAQGIASRNHEVTVVFQVKKGTTSALQDRSVNFETLRGETSAPSGVITKSNEPNALGVGSGVVPFFNDNVVSTRVVR